jgi:hypothetical protein
MTPRTPAKRLSQQFVQPNRVCFVERRNTYRHLTLGQRCLAKVSAKQTIPTGKIETKVTFMLCINDRMMDAVHIRRDDNPS